MEPVDSIDPRVDIGHVHLKVADLDRALAFYCGVLGFGLIQRMGQGAAFISAGGYHHHIGLNTWESLGGPPPAPGTTGLYHLAIRYPDRLTLADALRRRATGRRARRPVGGGVRPWGE
jgi:catechol 2,3-dioxygenase